LEESKFTRAVNHFCSPKGDEIEMTTTNVTIWKVTPETSHNPPVLIVTESDEWTDAVTLAEQTLSFDFKGIERQQYAHLGMIEAQKNEPASGN